MLASDKIANAFVAIVEEAEKALQTTPAEELAASLKTIISIAKHQSDIRGAKAGECTSHCGCKTKE